MVDILKILVIFLVINFVMYIVLSHVLKKMPSFRILRLSLIVTILIVILYIVLSYTKDISYNKNDSSTSYIIGQVEIIDNNDIYVKLLDGNIQSKSGSLVDVKISNNTVYRKQNILFEKSINYSQLSVGDTVSIICENGKTNNNYVTAQKITIK